MRRNESGQSLVEFALVLPVLLVLVVGIFDAGRAISSSNTLAHAVREGTRYAVVHGVLSGSPVGPGSATFTPPDSDSAVTAVVVAQAGGVGGAVTVQSTWPDGNANRGSRVVVSATVAFVPVLSAIFTGGGLQISLRASSSLVIEQ